MIDKYVIQTLKISHSYRNAKSSKAGVITEYDTGIAKERKFAIVY